MGISGISSNDNDYLSAAYGASASQQLLNDITVNTDTTDLTLAAIGNGAVKASATDSTVLATAIQALDKSYAATLSSDGLSAIITRVPVTAASVDTDSPDTSLKSSYYTDKVPDYGNNVDLGSLLDPATASTTDKNKVQQMLEQIMAMLTAMFNKQPPPPPPTAATADTTATVAATNTVVDSTKETSRV